MISIFVSHSFVTSSQLISVSISQFSAFITISCVFVVIAAVIILISIAFFIGLGTCFSIAGVCSYSILLPILLFSILFSSLCLCSLSRRFSSILSAWPTQYQSHQPQT